jgi:hypothetical protein
MAAVPSTATTAEEVEACPSSLPVSHSFPEVATAVNEIENCDPDGVNF